MWPQFEHWFLSQILPITGNVTVNCLTWRYTVIAQSVQVGHKKFHCYTKGRLRVHNLRGEEQPLSEQISNKIAQLTCRIIKITICFTWLFLAAVSCNLMIYAISWFNYRHAAIKMVSVWVGADLCVTSSNYLQIQIIRRQFFFGG